MIIIFYYFNPEEFHQRIGNFRKKRKLNVGFYNENYFYYIDKNSDIIRGRVRSEYQNYHGINNVHKVYDNLMFEDAFMDRKSGLIFSSNSFDKYETLYVIKNKKVHLVEVSANSHILLLENMKRKGYFRIKRDKLNLEKMSSMDILEYGIFLTSKCNSFKVYKFIQRTKKIFKSILYIRSKISKKIIENKIKRYDRSKSKSI